LDEPERVASSESCSHPQRTDCRPRSSSLFRTSAKKTAALKQCIEDADDTRVTKRQLISLCETRFLERHTAVVTFRQLFGFVALAEVLQEIKSWNSTATVPSASSLYASMHHFEFVVGLVIVENFAGLLLPVSRKLQAVENDLTQAIKDVTEALSALENLRPEAGFQKIFAEASLLAEHHGFAVSSPRLSKDRSVYRPTVGVEGDCAETYYRINVCSRHNQTRRRTQIRSITTARLLPESSSATTLHQ